MFLVLAAIIISLGGGLIAFASGHPVLWWLVDPLILIALDHVPFSERWLFGGVIGNIVMWVGIFQVSAMGLEIWELKGGPNAAS